MSSNSEKILRLRKRIGSGIDGYIASRQFQLVAEQALVDFIKRVKRGYMPDLSKIEGFTDSYTDLRKRYKSNLGDLAKANKSNATATGQMLDSMVAKVTQTGFLLIIQNTARRGELSGSSSRLTNAEVASYYALNRFIFDFSEPEISRIVRNIRKDILAVIKKSKSS